VRDTAGCCRHQLSHQPSAIEPDRQDLTIQSGKLLKSALFSAPMARPTESRALADR
jgi:hypothetical protein